MAITAGKAGSRGLMAHITLMFLALTWPRTHAFSNRGIHHGNSRLFLSTNARIVDERNQSRAEFHQIKNTETEINKEAEKQPNKEIETASSYNRDKEIEAASYYSRDPRDDLSTPIDEKRIRVLLGQRILARRKKEYEELDRVDRELRQIGVYAYDKDRIWTTEKNPPVTYLRRRARQIDIATRKQFGPAPYVQVGDEIDPVVCPLTIEEIHLLLSRRLRCRTDGKFDIADAIKFELLLNGVRWSDRLRQWRADGVSTFDESLKSFVKARLVVKEYSQNQLSANVQVGKDLTRVQRLIQARTESRIRRDFHLMDSITLELYKTYNVAVEDDNCTWSVGGVFGSDISWQPPSARNSTAPLQPRSSSTTKLLPVLFADDTKYLKSNPYIQSDYSRRIKESTLPRILHLVQERLHHREERSKNEVDFIQKELWATYNVGINDRLRQWSVGGIFEPPVTAGVPPPTPQATLLYSRSNDVSTLPFEIVEDIENLIRYFQTAVKQENRVVSNSIRERLRNIHGVVLNDENLNWHVETGMVDVPTKSNGNSETQGTY